MISVNNTDLITLRVTLLGLAHICRLSIDKVCDGINNIYFLVVVFIFHRKFYNLLKSVPSQNINDFTVFICYLPFTIFKRLFYLRGSKRKGGWSEPLENSNLLNSLSKFIINKPRIPPFYPANTNILRTLYPPLEFFSIYPRM